jgi:predicted 3-demethylubiquinone-9 3-methyltransferase (glyoxalase superfamily)
MNAPERSTRTRVRPFLMFQGEGRADAAIELYTSLVPDGRVQSIERFGPGEGGREGSVKLATIQLAGQTVLVLDSPVAHSFGFTPSFSFFVDVEDEREFERLATGLGSGGQFLMPPGEYGFSRRFAWLSDRFGVSWQINLP